MAYQECLFRVVGDFLDQGCHRPGRPNACGHPWPRKLGAGQIGSASQPTTKLLALYRLALAFGVLICTAGAAAVEGRRPNIVLLVLDDVGYSDLGCYGSEIRTPHIDRLAQRGLRFTRFDTKAICAPSRAALLTGVEPHSLGMADLPSRATTKPERLERSSICGEFPANVDMLPQALRRAGYSTFAVGKWHLIPDWEDGSAGNNASYPLQRGFDAFYGFKKGWTDQYHPALVRDNRTIASPNNPDYHLSEDLVEQSQAFIDAHRKQKPAAPFFLLLGLGVAHAPIQVPRAYVDHYAGIYERGWDRLREERFERMQRMGLFPSGLRLPARDPGDLSWDSLTDQQRRVYARFMATYAGFLEHGDAQIGRLITYLQELGLERNTLFVVLSDNGAASESKPGMFRHPYSGSSTLEEMDAHLDELGTDKTQALYQRPWAMLGSAPYRRYKLWPFLGGVRAPLIILPPGGSKDPGGIRHQLVNIVDLAPTIAEFAEAQFASTVAAEPVIPLAGISFGRIIAKPTAPSVRSVQFFELRGNRAITSGSWRAVTMHRPGTPFEDDRWGLYDLENDPLEVTDLAATHPQKLQELIKQWSEEANKNHALPLKEPTPAVLRASGFEDGW